MEFVVHSIKDKNDPTRPGNDIQFKLRVNGFMQEMENIKPDQCAI